jgi:hypothetical protein
MPELGSYGSVRGAAGNSRPLYVADCLANKQISPAARRTVSLCGRLAREPVP